MDKLNCTASTSKGEVLHFCSSRIGRTITIHYENNMYDGWGDDAMVDILLSPSGVTKATALIKTHYIHGVWVTENPWCTNKEV